MANLLEVFDQATFQEQLDDILLALESEIGVRLAPSVGEGMRVRITPAPLDKPRPFGERFAQFKGAVAGLPADLAEQHDHYRLGTPNG